MDKSAEGGVGMYIMNNLLGGLLFSFGKYDRKIGYTCEHGQMVSRKRRSTMKVSLKNVRHKKYILFKADADEEDLSASRKDER